MYEECLETLEKENLEEEKNVESWQLQVSRPDNQEYGNNGFLHWQALDQVKSGLHSNPYS